MGDEVKDVGCVTHPPILELDAFGEIRSERAQAVVGVGYR